MKLKNISCYALGCVIVVSLTGCIKKIKRKKLDAIELGTSKDTVIKNLGKPLSVGTIKQTGKNIEVLQYATTNKDNLSLGAKIAGHTFLSICTLGLWIPIAIIAECADYAPYSLYFTNNKLTESRTVESGIYK